METPNGDETKSSKATLDEKQKKIKQDKFAEIRKRARGNRNEEKIFMDKSKVLEMLPALCGKQDFRFRETEVRNILFVGRTRSGKSTVVRTMTGVQNVVRPLSIFSGTKHVHFRNFALKGKSGLDYTLNVIDTPGLFEVKKVGEAARSDEEILNMIAECLKNEITRLHGIILFCSLTAGVNDTDVIAMKKLIQTFGVDTNMAICVTRSENTTQVQRETIVTELEQHGEIGELLKQVNSNIFFMGAVDPDRVTDDSTLEKIVAQVIEDRANFLEFIFLCQNDTKIEDLKFVKDKRVEIKRKIRSRQNVLGKLMLRNNTDEEEIQYQINACRSEVQNLRILVSLFDSECLELYAKLCRDMDDLLIKLPDLQDEH